MDWFLGLLLVLSYPATGVLILGGCGACGRAPSRAVLAVAALWLLPAVAWLAYSPLSVCSFRLVRSYPYERDTEGGVWESYWCSRPCTGAVVRAAATVDEVRYALAQNATSVRVVGAGHSTSDLQCADDGVILSVDGLCSFALDPVTHVATFGAGCTVYEAQAWLVANASRQIRGYGSITTQRLGGAVSTSLHGQHPQPFANEVVGVGAVLANGTYVDDEPVEAWVGSMGTLGVLVEVRLRTHPLEYVTCTSEKDDDLEGALADSYLVGFEAKTVVRRGDGEVDDYLVRRCYHAAPLPSASPAALANKDDKLWGFLADNVALDAALFLGALVPAVPGITSILQASSNTAESRDGVVRTVDDYRTEVSYTPHFDEEYAVPAEACRAFVAAMGKAVHAVAAHVDVHVYVRRVDASAGWLTWAPVDSCAVRFEFFRFTGDGVRVETEVRRAVEDVVVAFHGSGHFGKPWYTAPHRLLHVSPQRERFLAYREHLDPNGVFLNAFTRAALFSNASSSARPASLPVVLPPALDTRLLVWRVLVALGIVASAALCCCAPCRRRTPTPTPTACPDGSKGAACARERAAVARRRHS